MGISGKLYRVNSLKSGSFNPKKTFKIASSISSMQCMNVQKSKLNIHSVLKMDQTSIQSCALSKSINVASKNLLESVHAWIKHIIL